MDKRTKKLRQYFPEANNETRLVILGPSQRLIIGKEPLQLTEYNVGENESMYAAFSEERNTIYIRLVSSQNFPSLNVFARKK